MLNLPEEDREAKRLDWIDDIADRFEAAWHKRPEIRAFLAEADSESELPLLLELIKIDFECRRRTGETCRLEDYFDEFPALNAIDQGTRDELIRHVRRVPHRAGPRESESSRAICSPCPHCGVLPDNSSPRDRLTCSACGELLNANSRVLEQFSEPTMLGKFQIEELIGTGSFGRVYRARDVELGRTVAIKVPRAGSFATEELEARFLREARSASHLVHPGIVKVHDIGRDGDIPFIVCDFIDGQTLLEAKAVRQWSVRELAEIVAQIADALHYAHEHHVVHRDTKPTNIIVDREGRPHITDFGLARLEQSETVLTLEGQVLGTPAYMSPEQASGDAARVDRRTDVYSLGVILFELLAGERPFRGSSRMLLHQVLHDEPRPPRSFNDSVPRDLESICLKAMAKAPARRYATAAEFRDDLRRFLMGEPTSARPSSSAERFVRWAKRSPATAALLMVSITLLLGLALGLSIYAHQQSVHAALLADALATAAQQRADAQASELRARKTSYQSDMWLAFRACEERRLNEIDRLLMRQVPGTLDTDLRGLEWYLLKHVADRRRQTIGHHRGAATEVAVFPDRRRIATVGANGTIRIWDTVSRTQMQSIHVQDDSLYAVAVSPDGRSVAVGTSSDLFGESQVWIYDVDTGQRTLALHSHSTNIEAIEYSPDGTCLASGSRSGGVHIWSFKDDSMRTIPNGQWNESLQFSSDGNSLVCQMDNDRIGVWDLQKLELVRSASNNAKPCWFSWSKTSAVIAYVIPHFRSVEFWSPDTGTRLATVASTRSTDISALTFSPNGGWLAVGYIDGNVEMWKLTPEKGTSQNPESLLVSTAQPAEMVVSGSASCLAFLDEDRLVVTGSDGSVVLYSPHAAERYWNVEPSVANGVCSFSPDGRLLAYGCDNGRIQIDCAATGESRFSFPLPKGSPTSITFAVDQPRLAAASESHEIFVWTYDEHELRVEGVLKTPADEHSPAQIVLNGDGSKLLSVDEDERGVRVWDVASQRHERTLKTRFGGRLVALSPDGRLVAAGHDFVYVWDFESGREMLTLKDGDFVTSLAFTPDSRMLITGHRDGSIRVRGLPSGNLVQFMTGHRHPVVAMAVTPDGNSLVTVDMRGVVRVWQPESGEGFGTLHRFHRQITVESLSFSSFTGCLALGSEGEDPRRNIVLLEAADWQLATLNANKQ